MAAQAEQERPQVVCPQCGGENAPRSGESFLDCAYCGTTLYLDRSALLARYRLPRLLDREQASAALRRWMAGNETVKDLDRKSTISSVEAVTFPMWMFRWAQGGRREVTVEPAAPTSIAMLADLAIPAGKLEPYETPEEGAEAIPVAIPVATARGWLEQRGIAAGDVSETALVEIPLWRAGYEHDGRSYQAIVEASTGKVLASVFPEKAESPFFLVAALGLLLFVVEGLLITNPIFKLLAYAVTSVPLLLLAWLVTRKV